MKGKLLKIHSIDNGFCRVNYIGVNQSNQKVYYCLQDEGTDDIHLYRSSDDLEPSHICHAEAHIFEVPTGNSTIEISVRSRLLQGDKL